LTRPVRLALVAIGVVVFLAISFVLARIFSGGGAERTAVTHLVKAEARGDATELIDGIDGCAANTACAGQQRANAARLKRPGDVQVLNYSASTGFGVADTHGTARIAWRAGTSNAVVQCARVNRRGNAVTGLKIHVLSLSAPIRSDASCP
jgi:hypothetical protein